MDGGTDSDGDPIIRRVTVYTQRLYEMWERFSGISIPTTEEVVSISKTYSLLLLYGFAVDTWNLIVGSLTIAKL